MTAAAASTEAYSLWIYDRHCTLIYHHDWTLTPASRLPLLAPGPDLLPGVSRCVTFQASSSKATGSVGQGYPSNYNQPPPAAAAASHKLPLTEHAKLIYGLVFSLRNILSKLSTSSRAQLASQLNTYTTPTYTLSHFQTSSMYTFVLLTDPVQPPSRGLPGSSSGSQIRSGDYTSTTSLSGGGIPGTGGMSLVGVLKQLVAGPWVDWVVKNPAMGESFGNGLEWEEMIDQEIDDDDEEDDEEGSGLKSEMKRGDRRRGVDSDGFRRAVEAVLAQNKLSTTFGARA